GTEGITDITLEANPEDLTPEYLSGLHEAGINRLSIGIQSFDDGLLGYMKRRHDGTKALFSVHAARRAGFDNISIDLLYGIPSLTSKLWEETLDRALALEPEHISAYHLTIEPATLLGRQHSAGKVTEIPQQESQEQFLILREKLVTSGYEHYEVSNFAKPSFRSRHNSSYWTGEKYLGIGPGAHSFDGMERRWCSMTVSEYIAAPRIVYHWETLTPNDIYNELVMTSLRCADGLTAAKISDRAGEKYTSYFTSRADGLLQRGLLQLEADRYFIHPRDFLISDNIISSLFI
ncbi:MAG: coproporphyrinogen III oxidase family protein, partial [Rikenellaceae bacterium]|nr:coproporphyrinogen III oxidase family protein [Rikenellaceae bacterium]